MPGVYIGDTKSLVFPVMCDAYLKQAFLDYNTLGVDLGLRGGLWGIRDFTLEALVIPYDINGYGRHTGGGIGLATSELTPPSIAENVTGSPLNDFQSHNYFGTGRLSRKMMLFYNQNFQLYLENTADSNVNRPAEYKLVAEFAEGTPSKVETEVIISGNEVLHGYYDTNGIYKGTTTNLRRFSETAQVSGSVITVASGETANIGVGEKIYDTNGELIGSVLSISGNNITLTSSPAVTVTQSIYAAQPRESLYAESMIKLSCTVTNIGLVKLYLNSKLLKQTKITLNGSFGFHPSNSYIGQKVVHDTSAETETGFPDTQFMGELFEIGMTKRIEPSVTSSTLTPGYSDIVFYYRFGEF